MPVSVSAQPGAPRPLNPQLTPQVGEVMHFMRISSQHHSVAIAQGPHTSLHHVYF